MCFLGCFRLKNFQNCVPFKEKIVLKRYNFFVWIFCDWHTHACMHTSTRNRNSREFNFVSCCNINTQQKKKSLVSNFFSWHLHSKEICHAYSNQTFIKVCFLLPIHLPFTLMTTDETAAYRLWRLLLHHFLHSYYGLFSLCVLTGKRPWWYNSCQVYPHWCDMPHYIWYNKWNKETGPTSDESIRDSSVVPRAHASGGTTSQNWEHWPVLTTQRAVCDTTSKISIYSTVKCMSLCHADNTTVCHSSVDKGLWNVTDLFHLTTLHILMSVTYNKVCAV